MRCAAVEDATPFHVVALLVVGTPWLRLVAR